MKIIETVQGPVPVEALGVTLIHEHLLLDARHSFQEPSEASKLASAYSPINPSLLHVLRQNPFMNLDNCTLFDEDIAVQEVARFKQLGGQTVVDATCRGIGRDPEALRRISVRTGLHIVMGTGYYLERAHPAEIATASIEKLCEIMVRDLVEGDEVTGIKAGYIGEIGISRSMTKQEERVLRAAAQAQSVTGVALSVHLPGWERLGHQVLDIVEEEGGLLNRTILAHMNPSWRDIAYQTGLADRGAYLGYDMIGLDYYFADQEAQSPSDEENATAIARLIDAGYVEKLLLSQDVFLKMMLTCYGGNGYAYIIEHFIPRLKRHGVSDESIYVMMVDNPARVLGVTA